MSEKRNLISVLLIIFCFGFMSACDTENSVEPPYNNYFVKYYGGDGDQTAVDLIVNSDGTAVVLGNWLSAPGQNQIYLLKVDATGEVMWERKIGTQRDKAKDIELTLTGHYVILSDFQKSESNIDLKLIRVSPEGVPIDSVVYGSSAVEISNSLTVIDDGGYIVTGSTTLDTTVIIDPNKPDDLSDIFHFRCNANLVFLPTTIWKPQFGPGTLDYGTKVLQFSAGVFYVFGSSNQVHVGNPGANQNIMYYPVNDGGQNGTPNYMGDFESDTDASAVIQVPGELGGGYLVVGTQSSPSGTLSLHVTRLRSPLSFNSVNDEQFDREIPVDARRITALSTAAVLQGDRGFLLIGNESRETGNNIWVTKIDPNGNQQWSASYGSEEEDDMGAAIRELTDGKILILGSVRLINNQFKIVLMKVNSTGQLMN
jgi:hypothetical protein